MLDKLCQRIVNNHFFLLFYYFNNITTFILVKTPNDQSIICQEPSDGIQFMTLVASLIYELQYISNGDKC